MNPLIAAEWAEYLKANADRQGRWSLQQANGKLCCLGALCELAIKNGVEIQVHLNTTHNTVSYNGHPTHLPPEVAEWAEMKSTYGELNSIITFENVNLYSLMSLNDNGMPWPQIADIILEHWAEL